MATIKTQLVVLGSGPGGYSAAFRAADLGLDVTLVERYSSLGGVCLNEGCVPTKTLLYSAKIFDYANGGGDHYGVTLAGVVQQGRQAWPIGVNRT